MTRARTARMSRPGALWVVLATLPCAIAGASLPAGPGSVLPLQDRIGDSSIVELVESDMLEELAQVAELARSRELRASLRRLRIRDATAEDPARLEALAREVGAQWFFAATLHEAERQPVPRVIISAKVFVAGADRLWWAGFQSATGADGATWLGLGGTDSLEELVRDVTARLVDDLAADPRPPSRPRLGRTRGTFLRGPVALDRLSRVAIVPMDSVTESPQLAAAETATDALYAALHQRGFALVLPGLVAAVLRDRSQLQPGAVNSAQWSALKDLGAASWVATGTVETWEAGAGELPDPWIAFSLRLVDTESGRIAWMGGRELTGGATAGLFELRTIYSAGSLTLEMMRSLLTDLTAAD